MELRVKRAPRIEAEITVPGDKSISHRAAIVAALSNGVCNLRGFLPSDDCMHTVTALRALGIQIEQPEPDILIVHGKKRLLTPPKDEINCGGSGTTMRLLAGLLAGQTFETRLVGNPSLTRRPMDRIIEPLRKMGADIVAEGPEQTPPLRIRGGSLRGIHYRSPVASAQVKSAILLAGLFAKGKTTVEEPSASRNHTELMFNYFLIRTAKSEDAIGVFVRMGAQVREAVEGVDQLEPRGVVEVTGVPLRGTVIHGKEIPQLIDELPVLAVAGALASGTTIIRHAQELRVKETDRIAAIAHNLRAMGAQVIEMNDGLEIHGPAPLRGGRIASFGDHRIAMAFAVAGLFADGETIIQDAECVEISYPGFRNALEQFMTTKRGPGSTPVIGSRSMAPVDD